MASSTLRSENDQVLDNFLNTPFWESAGSEESLLARDCCLDFPYAPPGMPKSFPRPKRVVLIDWLRRTVKNWSRVDIVKYPTKNPARYWVESRTTADVTWGGPFSRKFNCTHVELIVIENGKVTLSRTWSDPLAYYLGAGINLPVFHYDGTYDKAPESLPQVIEPKLPTTVQEAAEIRQKLFDYYLKPDFFDEDRDGPKTAHLHSPDFKIIMPFMPKGMQRVFDPLFAESTKHWVGRTLVEWHQQITDFERDEFLDPDVVLVETSGSHGKVKWDPSGATAGYFQDYVIKVKIQNFQVIEFNEYLDPINKLLAAGAAIQCFPFFY